MNRLSFEAKFSLLIGAGSTVFERPRVGPVRPQFTHVRSCCKMPANIIIDCMSSALSAIIYLVLGSAATSTSRRRGWKVCWSTRRRPLPLSCRTRPQGNSGRVGLGGGEEVGEDRSGWLGEFGGGAALAIAVEVVVAAFVALGGSWDPPGELEEGGGGEAEEGGGGEVGRCSEGVSSP